MHSDLFVVWLFMHYGLVEDLKGAGWQDISDGSKESIQMGVKTTLRAMDYVATGKVPWATQPHNERLQEKSMASFVVHHFPREEECRRDFHSDGFFCVPELQMESNNPSNNAVSTGSNNVGIGIPDGIFFVRKRITKEGQEDASRLHVIGAVECGRKTCDDKIYQCLHVGRNLIHVQQQNERRASIKMVLSLTLGADEHRHFRLYGMVSSMKSLSSDGGGQWCDLFRGKGNETELAKVFRAFYFMQKNYDKFSTEPAFPINLRVQHIHESAYKLVNKETKTVKHSERFLDAKVGAVVKLLLLETHWAFTETGRSWRSVAFSLSCYQVQMEEWHSCRR